MTYVNCLASDVETLKLRVKRGAYVLDSQVPNWAKRIEIKKLDLRSPCRCVIGQIFSERAYSNMAYADGIETLSGISDWTAAENILLAGKSVEWAVEHGFDRTIGLTGQAISEEYSALTDLWREEIASRLCQ